MPLTIKIKEFSSAKISMFQMIKKIWKGRNFNKLSFYDLNKKNGNQDIMTEYDYLKKRQYSCKQKQLQLNMILANLKLEYDEILYTLETDFNEINENDTQDKGVMTDNTEDSSLYKYCKSCLKTIKIYDL